MAASQSDCVFVAASFSLMLLVSVSDGIMGVMTVEFMNYFSDTPETIISAVVVSQFEVTMIGGMKLQCSVIVYNP